MIREDMFQTIKGQTIFGRTIEIEGRNWSSQQITGLADKETGKITAWQGHFDYGANLIFLLAIDPRKPHRHVILNIQSSNKIKLNPEALENIRISIDEFNRIEKEKQ
ncbi:MAG: hypothetical protein EXS52_01215 [Candidatus Staskawiczbacteria bacterium]|nr:hypothetical protein [Candidatus Staskawiczbacteria bacterium]